MSDEQTRIKKSSNGTERKFLEGPQSRRKEFTFVWNVARQFIKGFRELHFVGPCVTVFGSARFEEDHEYYTLARRVGASLADLGFTVMTGGGPGIMEAANRGAREAGGTSIGCNIRLPQEQQPNPYLDKQITLDHFFVRKVLLLKYSYAFIVMPGGFGTMDELFETLTLVQTKTISQFPVVLFGKEFYTPLMNTIQEMAEKGTISPIDMNLVLLTDSHEDAMTHITTYIRTNYKIKPRKRLWWLLEKR